MRQQLRVNFSTRTTYLVGLTKKLQRRLSAKVGKLGFVGCVSWIITEVTIYAVCNRQNAGGNDIYIYIVTQTFKTIFASFCLFWCYKSLQEILFTDDTCTWEIKAWFYHHHLLKYSLTSVIELCSTRCTFQWLFRRDISWHFKG